MGIAEEEQGAYRTHNIWLCAQRFLSWEVGMRHLRRIGLMPSLLFVGVLGGLMAPLPADAGTPTLTLQVDNGAITNVPLSSCTVPSGYSACFALQTGGTFSGTGPAGISRSFTIKNYLGAVPRLLVTDSNGSGLDNITFTTVEFAPAGTPPVTWGSVAANTGCPTCARIFSTASPI